MNTTLADKTADLFCDEFCPHKQTVDLALRQMPQNDEIDRLADAFKIFGDPSRIKIIAALLAEEMCVCDMSEMLEMSQSAVSHQLRLLRGAHLVKTRRAGKSVFYSLDDEHVSAIISQGLAHIRHTEKGD